MKISVVVPVYKVEEYIGQCAESIFSQTWEDVEFIFVDDGSPDDSIRIVEELLETRFPQRKAQTKIVRSSNSGLPSARIKGLAEVTGDYVIHVDSDDWVEPDYLALLAEAVLSSGADVAYCDYYKEYNSKKSKIINQPSLVPDDGKTAVSAINNSVIPAYMWNKLLKRSLIDIDSLTVPSYAMHEDICFMSQMLLPADKVVHVDKPLYHYRRKRKNAITAGSWSATRKDSAINMLRLYEARRYDTLFMHVCGQDILMRGGWEFISTLNFNLLKSYPDAVRYLSSMDYVKGRRVNHFKQVIIKNVCRYLNSR